MNSTDLNPCHNHPPFVDTLVVPDGWVALPDNCRVAKTKIIENKMSRDCKYSIETEDSRCAGCKWKAKE